MIYFFILLILVIFNNLYFGKKNLIPIIKFAYKNSKNANMSHLSLSIIMITTFKFLSKISVINASDPF